MSLATRCTACGTVFRVAQDQLKASEGWVRCGRCSEVFNALEGLFDLEGSSGPMPLARESGAALSPPTFDEPEQPAVVPRSRPAPLASDDAASDAPTSTLIDTQAATQAPSGFEASHSAAADREQDVDFDLVDSEVSDEALSAADESQVESPAFLKRAERAERWRRPRMRRALWALVSLMMTLLLVQFAVHQRHVIAARWPSMAPVLSALCAPAGCVVEAPRQLAALAVDSSGLTRLEGSSLYRLQLGVRNRGSVPVAMPALDLTLTDVRGDLVARRVLRAADLVPGAPDRIAAGGDWSALAVLDLGDRRAAGYTVELFYP